MLWLCLCLVSRTYSQTTLVNNGDTLTCLNEKELDKVITAFIEREGCFMAYDTLSVGYDALHTANEQLEGINAILANDLEMSKVVAQSLEAEKSATEKALKKEVRKRRLNGALVWVVSGVSAALMVLYVLK